MERKIYLAYGSNMNIKQMKRRCPYAKILGKTTLPDYELLFRANSRNNAVATVEPYPGGNVPALLWSISPQCELALDRYEGFPFLYRKETVTVQLGGQPVEAMMYVMDESHPIGTPNCYYYSIIREAYVELNFDTLYLAQAADDCAAACRNEY